MSLSCECGWGDYDWYYEIESVWRYALTDYKCYGCCQYGKAGDIVRRLTEYEFDEDGNELPPYKYARICEKCADFYDSLIELGFCLSADYGFIREAMRDYKEEYAVRQEIKNDGR